MRFLTFNEKLGRPECPYLVRWAINFGFFSIRLHHWLSGDDPRAKHSHPWWFVTLVLKGGYTDLALDQQGNEVRERMEPGTVRYRPADHIHTVDVDQGGCWTLMLTGRAFQKWGFYVPRKSGGYKFKKSNKFFLEHGHHPCATPGSALPDGSLVQHQGGR